MQDEVDYEYDADRDENNERVVKIFLWEDVKRLDFGDERKNRSLDNNDPVPCVEDELVCEPALRLCVFLLLCFFSFFSVRLL